MSALADGCQFLCSIISHKKVGSLFLPHGNRLFQVCCVELKTHIHKKKHYICHIELISYLCPIVYLPPLLSSPLLGRGHALEDRGPISPTLCVQHPMPCGGKEESGQRCAVLLALWALWGIPVPGKSLEKHRPAKLVQILFQRLSTKLYAVWKLELHGSEFVGSNIHLKHNSLLSLSHWWFIWFTLFSKHVLSKLSVSKYNPKQATLQCVTSWCCILAVVGSVIL